MFCFRFVLVMKVSAMLINFNYNFIREYLSQKNKMARPPLYIGSSNAYEQINAEPFQIKKKYYTAISLSLSHIFMFRPLPTTCYATQLNHSLLWITIWTTMNVKF